MARLYFAIALLALAFQGFWLANLAPTIPGIVWTRVHLLTIGVVAQFILGALPSVISKRSGFAEPGADLQWLVWLLANGSFIALLLSVPGGSVGIALAGAVGMIAALALMLAGIWRTGNGRSMLSNPVSRLMFLAPLFFVLGILMAMHLIGGWSAPGGSGGVLEAHLHANIWGFFGLYVAAMLLEVVPERVGTALRRPGLVSRTAWLLIAGAAALVLGPWTGIMPITMIGLVTYVAGTALMVANLAGTVHASRRWTPNLAHILVGYVWVFAPVTAAPIVLVTTGQLPAGLIEAAAIFSLVGGWILQLTLGAIVPAIQAGNNADRRDGRWISVWLVNAGVLTVWIGAFSGSLSGYVTGLGYALVAFGWLPAVVDIIRKPPAFAGQSAQT